MNVEVEPSIMSMWTNNPMSPCLFVCLVNSVSHLCSPTHLFLIHSVCVCLPHCSTAAKVSIHLLLSLGEKLPAFLVKVPLKFTESMVSSCLMCQVWMGTFYFLCYSCNVFAPVCDTARVGGKETIQRRRRGRGLEKEAAPGRTSQQGGWDRLQSDSYT